MAWLKYYRDENLRHPALHAARISFDDACDVIGRLAKEYEIVIDKVERTSGRRVSHYAPSSRTIRLNTDHLSWLLTLHEFAHGVVRQYDQKRLNKWKADELAAHRAGPAAHDAFCREHPRPTRARWHCAEHAEQVDILARRVVERGWLSEIPAARAARDLARIEKEAARAASASDSKVVRQKKVEHRQAQVVRLEAALKRLAAREKALQTRLKRARRSLSGLVRASVAARPPDAP